MFGNLYKILKNPYNAPITTTIETNPRTVDADITMLRNWASANGPVSIMIVVIVYFNQHYNIVPL